MGGHSSLVTPYIWCHDKCHVVIVLQKILPQLVLQEGWRLQVFLWIQKLLNLLGCTNSWGGENCYKQEAFSTTAPKHIPGYRAAIMLCLLYCLRQLVQKYSTILTNSTDIIVSQRPSVQNTIIQQAKKKKTIAFSWTGFELIPPTRNTVHWAQWSVIIYFFCL